MNLPPPDWARIQVDSRAQNTGAPTSPLGDPTRWGGSVLLDVPAAIGLELASNQFIRAQVADNYSRLWSAIGNVTAPAALWATPAGIVPLGWSLWLEVVQGTGQQRITQLFDLRKLTTIGDAVYNPFLSFTTDERRSFAIVGGLLGMSLDMRVRTVNLSAVAAQVDIGVLIAPFAPGGGL